MAVGFDFFTDSIGDTFIGKELKYVFLTQGMLVLIRTKIPNSLGPSYKTFPFLNWPDYAQNVKNIQLIIALLFILISKINFQQLLAF